jgi:hypothetical protein
MPEIPPLAIYLFALSFAVGIAEPIRAGVIMPKIPFVAVKFAAIAPAV